MNINGIFHFETVMEKKMSDLRYGKQYVPFHVRTYKVSFGCQNFKGTTAVTLRLACAIGITRLTSDCIFYTDPNSFCQS